jgi:hypothetical protein
VMKKMMIYKWALTRKTLKESFLSGSKNLILLSGSEPSSVSSLELSLTKQAITYMSREFTK